MRRDLLVLVCLHDIAVRATMRVSILHVRVEAILNRSISGWVSWAKIVRHAVELR